MTIIELIVWFGAGAIVGLLVKTFTKQANLGWTGHLLSGLIGGVIGGFSFDLWRGGLDIIGSGLAAIFGTLLLLFAIRVSGGSTRSNAGDKMTSGAENVAKNIAPDVPNITNLVTYEADLVDRDIDEIPISHISERQMSWPEENLLDTYNRLQQTESEHFSNPFFGQVLLLSGPEREMLHEALLDAFDPNEMRRLLNFKLNRNMSDISLGQDKRTLYFDIIEKSSSQGWTGVLVEQAYRVNSGNGLLRAFVAEHLPSLLKEDA